MEKLEMVDSCYQSVRKSIEKLQRDKLTGAPCELQ